MDTKKALSDARAALQELRAKRLAAVTQGATPRSATKGSMPASARKLLAQFGVQAFETVRDTAGNERVKGLLSINTADKKYAYIPADQRAAIKELKEAVDVAVICSKILKTPVRQLKFWQDDLQFRLKTLGIHSGEDGFEWIPTIVSDSYIEEFNLERKVAGLFMEVKMPSNPYKWPVLTQGAIARKVGEVAALTTPQVFKTDKTILFDAVKLTNQYALPEELNEDSAIDQVKVIREELIIGQEKAMEIAILEGDTAGTLHHFSQLIDLPANTPYSGVGSDPTSPELIFDGIRKRIVAAGSQAWADAGGNPVTETELSQARAKMGKFGIDPSQLALLSGVKVYNQLLQLDDVRTLEQYGPQATVLSGELAKYEGIPVIVSEYLREDLTNVGVNGSSGNTFASVLIVNRKRWFVGTRRPISILVQKNRTQFDVLDLVSFSRKAFQAVLKADGSNYALESSAAAVFDIGL